METHCDDELGGNRCCQLSLLILWREQSKWHLLLLDFFQLLKHSSLRGELPIGKGGVDPYTVAIYKIQYRGQARLARISIFEVKRCRVKSPRYLKSKPQGFSGRVEKRKPKNTFALKVARSESRLKEMGVIMGAVVDAFIIYPSSVEHFMSKRRPSIQNSHDGKDFLEVRETKFS